MSHLKVESKNAKPISFLRWAGSKQRHLPRLSNYFSSDFKRYHEPFLGGGNVFLNLVDSEKESHLSDLNPDLVNCFKIVKSFPNQVIERLGEYKNTKQDYINERHKVYQDPIKSAAKFIYINRTCFNGIYRVNSKGIFNVPYGYRRNVDLVTEKNIHEISRRLRNSNLYCSDFSERLREVASGDLVFLDPPYTTAHQNNGFIEYNQKIFSWDDQENLKNAILQIASIGAYFVLTNAAHESIRELYKDFGNPTILDRFSLIGGKGAKREKVQEFIYSNVGEF